MKLDMQPHRLFALFYLAIGCSHGRPIQTVDPPSKKVHQAADGDIPTVRVNPECGHQVHPTRVSVEETNLAVNSSIKLLHSLRGKDIPTKIVREAVASGLPIVETVLGDEVKPIFGPDLRSKPFPAFARLMVVVDNIKLNCLQAESGRPIEFVPIVVVWTVEGQPGTNVRRWVTEEDENYYYGVRLDEHRGDIFFYRLEGIATEIDQSGDAKTTER